MPVRDYTGGSYDDSDAHWTNPFANFLKNARSEISRVLPEPEVRTDASLLPRRGELESCGSGLVSQGAYRQGRQS